MCNGITVARVWTAMEIEGSGDGEILDEHFGDRKDVYTMEESRIVKIESRRIN